MRSQAWPWRGSGRDEGVDPGGLQHHCTRLPAASRRHRHQRRHWHQQHQHQRRHWPQQQRDTHGGRPVGSGQRGPVALPSRRPASPRPPPPPAPHTPPPPPPRSSAKPALRWCTGATWWRCPGSSTQQCWAGEQDAMCRCRLTPRGTECGWLMAPGGAWSQEAALLMLPAAATCAAAARQRCTAASPSRRVGGCPVFGLLLW